MENRPAPPFSEDFDSLPVADRLRYYRDRATDPVVRDAFNALAEHFDAAPPAPPEPTSPPAPTK